ncbi:cell division protein FtsQ/DivIB [Bacillus sp. AK128]
MEKGKVLTLEDRIPKLKQQRRQKANRRLIFSVSIFFLLIIGILYLQSPFSHIATIEVNGNVHVSEGEIINLSGLSNETSIWSVKSDLIIEKIKKNKEIKKVVIKRSLPNTVLISVEEMKRVAYAMNEGNIVPILENGLVLEPSDETYLHSDAPLLMNWETGSALQEMASELAKLSPAITNSISEVHHTPQESDPFQITLFMNDGHEVRSTITDFAKKMSAYPAIVNQLDPNLKGIIHMEVAYYFESYEKVEEVQEKEEEVNEDESEG